MLVEHASWLSTNKLTLHGKDRDDFCVVVSFYPIKENLLKDFSVKARINQSLDIPLGHFYMGKNYPLHRLQSLLYSQFEEFVSLELSQVIHNRIKSHRRMLDTKSPYPSPNPHWFCKVVYSNERCFLSTFMPNFLTVGPRDKILFFFS